MLVLAVAAKECGRIIRGRAAVRSEFFSTMPTISPTFACFSSVSVMVASVALGQGVVLNEELTVIELTIMKQAHLHQHISFNRGPLLKEEGLMRFPTFQ